MPAGRMPNQDARQPSACDASNMVSST